MNKFSFAEFDPAYKQNKRYYDFIWKYAQKLFLPKFSELELLTFVYLLMLVFLQSLPKIVPEAIKLVQLFRLEYLLQLPLWDTIRIVFGILIILAIAVGLIYKLIYHALHSHKMSLSDKEMLAPLFYFMLGGFSFFSTKELLNLPPQSILDYVNRLVSLFILIQSAGILFLTYLIMRLEIDNVLGKRVTDEQLSKLELSILIVAGLVIFALLRPSHSISSTVILSYFYLTFLINLLHKAKPTTSP